MKKILCIIISALIFTSVIISAHAVKLNKTYTYYRSCDANTDSDNASQTDTEYAYGGENYIDLFDNYDTFENSDSDDTVVIISDIDSEEASTATDTVSDSDIGTDSLTDTEPIMSESDSQTDSQTDSDTLSWLPGDVDLNGEVNMLDVVLLQRYIAKLCQLNDTQKLAADVDYDNNRTMKDVVLIQKYIAKLITVF